MSRRNDRAVWAFVYIYSAVIVTVCLVLTLDRGGWLEKSLEEPLFPIPFYPKPVTLTIWKLLGGAGGLMFGARWVVQMYQSRKVGRPVIGLTFWIVSVVGSQLTLIYFIFSPKQDMVGVLNNFVPSFVAAYNLYLELTHRAKNIDGGDDAKKLVAKDKSDEEKKDPPPDILPHQAKGPMPIIQIAAQESAAGE